MTIPELGDVDGSGKSAPGRVVKWYKSVGDVIKSGDTIADIEMKDAFTFGYECEDEGTLISITEEADAKGKWMPVGTEIGVLRIKDEKDDGGAAAAAAAEEKEEEPTKKEEEAASGKEEDKSKGAGAAAEEEETDKKKESKDTKI